MERRICPLCKGEKDLFTLKERGKAKLETEVSSGGVQMRRQHIKRYHISHITRQIFPEKTPKSFCVLTPDSEL